MMTLGGRTSSLQQLLLAASAEQLSSLKRKSKNHDDVSSPLNDNNTATRNSSSTREGEDNIIEKKNNKIDENSPQAYLDAALKARGYSTTTTTTTTKYSTSTTLNNKPMIITDLQLASYGTSFKSAVKSSNYDQVQRYLDAGLSPNACNGYGESLLHLICRNGGNKRMLQMFLEAGGSVQNAIDDYGRTPLSDACWQSSTNFDLILLLLEADPNLLFLQDRRGGTPLMYIPKSNWNEWNIFLDSILDWFWPIITESTTTDNDDVIEATATPPPPIMLMKAKQPTVDVVSSTTTGSKNLSLEVVEQVANGKLEPEFLEVAYLLQGQDDDYRMMDMMMNDNDDDDDDSIGTCTYSGGIDPFSSSSPEQFFFDDNKEDGWPTMTMVHPMDNDNNNDDELSSSFCEQFLDDYKEDGWPTMTKKMVHNPLKLSAAAASTFNNTLPPPTKRNAVMAHSA